MRLSDCNAGDTLAVLWRDATSEMHDTEQLVVLCSTPRKSKAKGGGNMHMVELIDPATMCTYRAGAPELGNRHYNAFAVQDLEVVELIERRHFTTDDGGDGDLLDPLRGRRTA